VQRTQLAVTAATVIKGFLQELLIMVLFQRFPFLRRVTMQYASDTSMVILIAKDNLNLIPSSGNINEINIFAACFGDILFNLLLFCKNN
jgi:hypothetical protein